MAYKRVSPIPIVEGGTTVQSFTAYAPICAGTSSTGALQSASTGIGTSGLVFTGNGSSSLPSFQTHTGSCMIFSGHQLALNQTAAIEFIGMNGAINATEANTKFVVPYACTASNLYVNVFANASTTGTTVTLRKNGVSQALQATITATTTGVFSDTNAAHNVSISAGDTIDWDLSQATTGGVTGTITMQLTG